MPRKLSEHFVFYDHSPVCFDFSSEVVAETFKHCKELQLLSFLALEGKGHQIW